MLLNFMTILNIFEKILRTAIEKHGIIEQLLLHFQKTRVIDSMLVQCLTTTVPGGRCGQSTFISYFSNVTSDRFTVIIQSVQNLFVQTVKLKHVSV